MMILSESKFAFDHFGNLYGPFGMMSYSSVLVCQLSVIIHLVFSTGPLDFHPSLCVVFCL